MLVSTCLTLPFWEKNLQHTSLLSPFIYPARSDFFFNRLQLFLHTACNLLPPEELPPHAKNDECGY